MTRRVRLTVAGGALAAGPAMLVAAAVLGLASSGVMLGLVVAVVYGFAAGPEKCEAMQLLHMHTCLW